MTALNWLMLANVALWAGLGMYAALLCRSQNLIRQRLDALETPHD